MPRYSTTMNKTNVDPLYQELSSYHERFTQVELDNIFSYIVSDNPIILPEIIENIKTIFSNLDPDYYIDNPSVLTKVKSIVKACDLRLLNNRLIY